MLASVLTQFFTGLLAWSLNDEDLSDKNKGAFTSCSQMNLGSLVVNQVLQHR